MGNRLELGVSSGLEESLLGSLPVGDGPEVVEVSLLVVGYVEVVGVSAMQRYIVSLVVVRWNVGGAELTPRGRHR